MEVKCKIQQHIDETQSQEHYLEQPGAEISPCISVFSSLEQEDEWELSQQATSNRFAHGPTQKKKREKKMGPLSAINTRE